MLRPWLIALALVVACGSDEEQATTAPDPAPEAPPEAETSPAEPTEPEAPPEPEGDPVDLLQAVPTTVKVSSAYRDRSSQVPRLFDGDDQTAWNSATDDLVGSWIEVELPEDATVDHLEMTAGYLKSGGDTDLFTGNHRVSKVKVLREGQEVGSYDLLASSRALQSIPASGGGGTWRIEIAETVPGSKESWKEICISELRVFGRAPDAAEAAYFPRWAVGDGEPDAAPEPPGDLRLATHQLVNKWLEHDKEWLWTMEANDTGDWVWEEGDTIDLRDAHRSLLRRALALAGDAGDRIRRELILRRDSTWESYRDSLDTVAVALSERMDGEGDEATCRWAKGLAHLLLQRASILTSRFAALTRTDASYDVDPDALLDFDEALDDANEAFEGDARTTTARLLRMDASLPVSVPGVEDLWSDMREQLQTAQRTCGWD